MRASDQEPHRIQQELPKPVKQDYWLQRIASSIPEGCWSFALHKIPIQEVITSIAGSSGDSRSSGHRVQRITGNREIPRPFW